MNDVVIVITFIICVTLGIVCASIFGIVCASIFENKDSQNVKTIQVEAVERGYASWDINSDGTIVFKWKDE